MDGNKKNMSLYAIIKFYRDFDYNSAISPSKFRRIVQLHQSKFSDTNFDAINQFRRETKKRFISNSHLILERNKSIGIDDFEANFCPCLIPIIREVHLNML